MNFLMDEWMNERMNVFLPDPSESSFWTTENEKKCMKHWNLNNSGDHDLNSRLKCKIIKWSNPVMAKPLPGGKICQPRLFQVPIAVFLDLGFKWFISSYIEIFIILNI